MFDECGVSGWCWEVFLCDWVMTWVWHPVAEHSPQHSSQHCSAQWIWINTNHESSFFLYSVIDSHSPSLSPPPGWWAPATSLTGAPGAALSTVSWHGHLLLSPAILDHGHHSLQLTSHWWKVCWVSWCQDTLWTLQHQFHSPHIRTLLTPRPSPVFLVIRGEFCNNEAIFNWKCKNRKCIFKDSRDEHQPKTYLPLLIHNHNHTELFNSPAVLLSVSLKCRVHCGDLLNCGDVNAESVRSRLTVPGWVPALHTAVTYDHQTNIRNYTDQWMIETVQSSDNWFVSLSSFIICFSVVMMERWCPGLETQVGNVQWVWTVWDQWYWERRWLSVRHSSATLSQCCGCIPGKESSQQSIASERNLDRIWTQDWTGSLSHLSLRSWFHRVVVSSEQLLHYNTHLPLSSCHLTRE